MNTLKLKAGLAAYKSDDGEAFACKHGLFEILGIKGCIDLYPRELTIKYQGRPFLGGKQINIGHRSYGQGYCFNGRPVDEFYPCMFRFLTEIMGDQETKRMYFKVTTHD